MCNMLDPRGFIQSDEEYGAAFLRFNELLLDNPGPLPTDVQRELDQLAAEMDFYLIQTQPGIASLH